MTSQGRVSSPASTGGAGTFFEQHVNAYWLAQLLVRGIPPVIHDCVLVEIHLQTEHLGWNTDDFLVIGQNGSGVRRKLAGQVKRTFTVSSTDDECKKAVQDFWKDFRNPNVFSPVTDRLALVTLRGTNTLLEHFSGLLECSRVARDSTDFEHRLSNGVLNSKAVHYCNEFQTIIGEAEGRSVIASEIWPFLRVLYVLSLDLQTGTRQTEVMIKTLLAHTSGEADGVGVAETSWNALLALVGEGMPGACSLVRDDLPEDLRQRHSLVGETEHRALRALSDHAEIILRGIRSTIGRELHLARAGLVQQVLEKMESVQVVLVSGPAGSGKSAIAKDAFNLLSKGYFAFSFRAEEFAQPHFDATLQSGQIPANSKALGAVLAGQDRKVLLIESLERLLEKSTRDAFSDLMTLAAADKSLRIIVTCRDYSTDLVRASFLASAGVDHVVIVIPQLDDGEMLEVESALPALARPLANPSLRRVFRNPYFLDKALQISWAADRPLPESERQFRAIFWQQIIRADDRPADGVPRRRAEAFEQIAVRRARALTPFVNCRDLDPAIVDNLFHDSLITFSDQSAMLMAPAHDVLEDWAILQWIEEQHLASEGSFRVLSEVIGTHPAMRRAYRKWLAELIESDPSAADRLFSAAVAGVDVSPQFRDDTLVSLLRAPSSPAFLRRHVNELLANGRNLFKRVIHLLRVACVTTPSWLPPGAAGQGSLFNVPDGSAWAAVLRVVQNNIQEFTSDRMLLLGLIEDWARGVSWWAPYPEGADSVAVIAHWLLPNFDTYRSEGPGQRTLKVIAKIPKADVGRFEALLRGTDEEDDPDRTVDIFRGIIFPGLEGTPAARDLPSIVVSIALDYLLCSEAELQDEWGYGGLRDLDQLFGIKASLHHDYFPESAYRGPWISLLRNHPNEGMGFLITIFNHSAEWYAHPRVSEPVEPPFEVELTFGDGTSRKQWGNPRLWNWYRGTSVGPYVLQSLLMALERWVLEFAEAHPSQLDAILLDLLRRSDSVALTAVVASVAVAFPHESSETLIVLLRSRICILLDRQRMATESKAPSRLSGLMPPGRAENRVYEEERKEADALPHRTSDLEAAILNLQLGPFAARVHEVLDQYRDALPSASEQSEDDRIWRLSMHRMDLRSYSATEVITTDADSAINPESAEPERHQIRLDPNEPEPDVREMVDESAARLNAMNARLDLLMWALQVFKNKDAAIYDPTKWRQKLSQAQTSGAANPGSGETDVAQGGPGIVAAVCIRDHWQEMSDQEQDWCVEKACSEVMRRADTWDQVERAQRYDMDADRSCAAAMSMLIGKTLSEAQRSQVEQVFAVALTHPLDEVRSYAVWGIAMHLWPTDQELAMRCVNAFATEAILIKKARDREKRRRYDRRRQIDEITAEAASAIRQRFWYARRIAKDAYQKFDTTEWFGAEANGRILTILSRASSEPAAIAAFTRAAQTLVDWWDSDNSPRPGRGSRHREHSHEDEMATSELLQSFVMRTSEDSARGILQPLLNAVDHHPREVHWIVLGLIAVEDREPNTQQFWFLWKLFADNVRRAPWLAWVDDGHSTRNEMVSAIFLGSPWKEDIRHWRSLEGYVQNVHTLFEDLLPSSVVLYNYVKFLYHVGEQSLPEAFVHIVNRLQSGDAQRMLRETDTVFMLEVLLQRHVYGRPLELKRNPVIRGAVMVLLDLLVENGSSAAFRMRDDFVTPLSTA